MRKIIFILLAFLCLGGIILILGDIFSSTDPVNPPILDPTVSNDSMEIAQKVIDLISHHEFDSLQEYYNESMKENSYSEKMKNLWIDFSNSAGPFEKIMEIKSQKIGITDHVTYTCKFQKRRVDIHIFLNSNTEIERLEIQLL